MSLGEIQNKLYEKKVDENLGKVDPTEFDIEAHLGNSEEGENPKNETWSSGSDPKVKFWKTKYFKVGAYALGIILLILSGLLGFFKFNQSSFSESNVAVKVDGPDQAQSGQLVTFEISYANNNRKALNDAVLKVSYPEDFKPEDNPNFKVETQISGSYSLGTVQGERNGKVVVNGRMYSPRGAQIYIKAEMSYSPSGTSSTFVAKSDKGTTINSTPLSIEILAPQNIASGDEVNYLVTYKNNGEKDFSDIKVRIDFPEGFTFSSSNPKPFEGNNVWYIGNLTKGQEGKIVATGKLEGNRDEVKNVRSYIGALDKGNFIAYSEGDTSTKIEASALIISQTVNGVSNLNVKSGDYLKFELTYKNVGSVGLGDVIINEILDSPVLDYKTLNKTGGSFDEESKILTFKASDYPVLKHLEPGQGGVVKFSIKVKDVIPMSSAKDKNFIISSVAKIDSPDIATPVSMNKIISGNKMDMRLNSKLVLDVKGFYDDDKMTNTGPMPPKINNETTYTVHWLVSNVSNDVTDAKVEAVLPTSVTATGRFFPENAGISYNERTNSLVWDIGGIEAGTGILSSAREVSFQVRVKPSPEQKGKVIDLVGPSTATAKDQFTGESLKYQAPIKKLDLIGSRGNLIDQRVVE